MNELGCKHEITTYNDHYSRESLLNKNTKNCNRKVYSAGFCKRHYKLNLRKTIESTSAYAHKMKVLGRLEESEKMTERVKELEVRYEAI